MSEVIDKPVTGKSVPDVKGLPFIGNTLEMAKDPAAFFVRCYRDYGPAYRVNVFGRKQIVIAGTEAAKLMTTRQGRECLRSREFWGDMAQYQGSDKLLTMLDGEEHQRLRSIMRDGFSREAVAGRYHEVAGIVDSSIARDWTPGKSVPVVEAFQYMIVQVIGEIMAGHAPLEYVKDIRTNILFLLNVLVTRVKPKFFLKAPKFLKAEKRVRELGEGMIAEFKAHAEKGTLPKNLLGDVVQAHFDHPDFIQEKDLILMLTGPYVAGLDTVANTIAACTYAILKTPGVLEKVQAEADALYAKDTVTEADIRGLDYIQGCLKEAMRMWPIAVAQMRTATKDFEFEGYKIPEGEMMFIGTSVPHFMEEYFPEPEKFDPLRYSDDRKEHMKPGVYAPFGRGPHTCLGQNLAEVLMGTIMSRLFHRLDLSLDPPGYTLKTKSAPTPGPAMSFAVKVKGERKPATPLTPEKIES